MTELEHRYAKVSLLKVGIAIIGFFLLMSVAVTRCLFNEKGIMNIVTTTSYLLKEQQYYNQIICVSAKDAGFNQNETNKLMIDLGQTDNLVAKTSDNVFSGNLNLLDPDEFYRESVKKFLSNRSKKKIKYSKINISLKKYRNNLHKNIHQLNESHSLKKALNVFWFLKNNINFINAGLILITSLLIMILCELEERSKLLFTIGVITMGIAVALLIITITLSLTSTFFVEQSMGGETAAIVASSVKSLRTYLWFNIFLLCIVGFSSILISAKDDEFMHK
ncbi:hypothetical protein [Ligilactobacillus ruminis]|uniref:Uncharacterized protein n=3 Tax=Ligilactobacillus ruminis TaxID=1623 RepID=A0A6A8GQ49_9LACO|nr:hypothetical protein [Ligilactobacillus ruminis]HCI90184.1 hypothetical protein [Lactobacillus sp.]EGM52978.1 hypothetical protein LRU_00114 [Ligilactobacillus ruminis SPM0211]MSA21127.1 hypothetical protein [Ligilactobacillus ruminis]MSA23173.1 hypothetical protein [Ligilactobacillus ruminis]MSA24958.1 hypothetical protein [Ligilactobacillus ruminis]